MLEQTHRRLAREIASVLKLSDRQTGLLEAGSVNPDSWANFPHHRSKTMEIAKNILFARMLYLTNDDECFAKLGEALHYIADRWTLRIRIYNKHTTWEEKIDEMPILNDYRLKEVIEQTYMPQRAIRAYICLLGVLPTICKRLLTETPSEASEETLEERMVKELVRKRSYVLVKRCVREELTSELFVKSFLAKIPDTSKNVLIWFVPPRSVVGVHYVNFLERVMKTVEAIKGIIIVERGRYTEATEISAREKNIDLILSTTVLAVEITALPSRPTIWSTPLIDLNFAYRICSEVAHSVLSP